MVIGEFRKVEMTCHELSQFLRKKDNNWRYVKKGNYHQFICKGEIVAVVKYQNSPPLKKETWIK